MNSSGCVFINAIQARCGKQSFTDWFGRLYYDQTTDKSSEKCSWNFIPPQNMSSALILKVVSFPVRHYNMHERNYIVLPGGSRMNERNLRSHLHRCKRYVKQNDPNACTDDVLDNYCSGETIESLQWPPTLTSFSSQTSGKNISQLFYLGFTISYVYIPCPSKKLEIKPDESTTISSITPAPTTSNNDTVQNNPPTRSDVQSRDTSLLVIGIGSLAVVLVVGCGIAIFVLLKKLRQARLENDNMYITNKESIGAYTFATDQTGTLVSTHEYATLRPVRNRSTSSESLSVPVTGYLTMRSSTEKKTKVAYAEIKTTRNAAAEPYVNDYNENDERKL